MTTRPTGLTCDRCGAATNGVVLCGGCQRTAQYALTNIARSHRALFSLPNPPASQRRPQRVSDPTGNAAGNPPAPSPIEDAAAGAKALLADYGRRLVESRPQLRYPEADSVEALASLLSQQIRSIATLDWAGELARQLTRLELSLRKLVAANTGRWYAGVCGAVLDEADPDEFCTRVLYADPGSATVRCPACGTTWPLTQRRRILLDAARDTETNVATIARAIGALLDLHRGDCKGGSGCGCPPPSQAKLERRIQNWIDRDRLERRGHLDVDGKVRKTYRLGDVLDLLLEDRATRQARRPLDNAGVRTYTSE